MKIPKKKTDSPWAKISLREAILTHRYALSLWMRLCPALVWSTALSAFLTAIKPYVTIWFSAQILNELAGGRDPRRVVLLAIITLSVTTALSFMCAAVNRWNKSYANISLRYVEKALSEKLMSIDFSILDRQETFDLLSKIRSAISWSDAGLPMTIELMQELLDNLFRLAGAVVLSAGLIFRPLPHQGNWMDLLNHPVFLLVLLLFIMGITWLSSYLQNKYVVGTSQIVSGDKATLLNRAFDYFCWDVPQNPKRGMDIRLYQQAAICRDYTESTDLYMWNQDNGKYVRSKGAWLLGGSNALGLLSALPVYAYVCLKAWAGAFGVGSASQYISSVTSLFSTISNLLSTLHNIRYNTNFLRDTFQLLDLPNEMYQGSLTTEKRSDRQYQVEFRDVSFRYPDTEAWALRHVNLSFQIGRRLAVVGENGSGKTTFIKLLCRLYDPTEGEILLNGIDIRKYQYQDYLRLFSVVFQDFQLLPLSLGQNVAASETYDPALVADCLEKAGFGPRLAQLEKGLETSVYRTFSPDGVEFSGGEAQKIALARALYRDAPFIILDEPTAALDPLAEAEVYSKFDQIAGDKTAVYISHRLSSCRFCDDIAVFHQGQVVQKGSHDALLADADGKYAALWNAQAQYYTKKDPDAPAEADPA